MATDSSLITWLLKLANRLNPLDQRAGSTPRDGCGPRFLRSSLMPRSSMHQGVAGGLAVISARAIGQSVDRVVRLVAPETAPLAWRIGARAALAGGGAALGRISETEDETTARASSAAPGS